MRDYRKVFYRFLPPSTIWPTDKNSVFYRLVTALMAGFTTIDRAATDMMDDALPTMASDKFIDEWERLVGIIPDDNLDIESRRLAVTTKLIAISGQTLADYRAIAAIFADGVEFAENMPMTCVSQCNAQLKPFPWIFTLSVYLPRGLSATVTSALKSALATNAPAHVTLFYYEA